MYGSYIRLDKTVTFLSTGAGRSPELGVSLDVQHGAKLTESGGDQPRIHAGEIVLPVPELRSYS